MSRQCAGACGSDAGDMRGRTPQRAGGFGGLSPSKAAQLRWSRQRGRETSAEKDDDALRVTAPVRVARVIHALEKRAVTGDAHAARELRSGLTEYPPKRRADLTRLRSAVRHFAAFTRLLAEDEAGSARLE